MISGVVVDIGELLLQLQRITDHRRAEARREGTEADCRNGTSAGKFETMSGFCGDVVFAAGQPGCMSISTSPWPRIPLTHSFNHLPHPITGPDPPLLGFNVPIAPP